ncbi:MAG: PKD domain-containing protein [Chitinophagales bacterium]
MSVRFLLQVFIFFFLSTCQILAQSCNSLSICNDDGCGGGFVNYVASGSNVFCEGGNVTLENQSSISDFQEFVIDWGDGIVETVPNYNNVVHTYNYEDIDPCESEGKFDQQVCYVGKKSCSSGESCSTQSTFITVRLRPVAEFNFPDEVCIGEPASFNELSCNATTFAWNFGDGGTSTSENPSHTYNSPGIYTVNLTVTNNCSSHTMPHIVKVVSPPEPNFSYTASNVTKCNPLKLTFSNSSDTINAPTEWSITPSNGWNFTDTIQTVNSTHIEVIFTSPGEYIVELVGTNKCGTVIKEEVIEVIASPTVSLATIPNQCSTSFQYCPASSVTFNDYVESVTWEFPGGSPSSAMGKNPGCVNYNTPGNHEVKVTVTNNCGSNVATRSFILTDPNSGSNLNPQAFCVNDGLFNLDTEVLAGDWSGPGVNSQDRFNPTSAGSGIHTLIYTYTENGCDIESTLQVTVNALPTVNGGNYGVICLEDAPIQLKGTPSGGTWEGEGLSGNDPITFDPNAMGTGSYNFTYTYTDPITTCTNTDVVGIQVQNVEVDISANETSYCNSTSSIQLTASPSGGDWSGNGVAANGNFVPSNAGVGTHILTYTFTNTNGCTDSKTLEVTVSQAENINAGEDMQFCENDEPVVLEAIEPANGEWSGNGVTDGMFNPQNANIGDNIITYSFGTGTCKIIDTKIFKVDALPTITINSIQNVCIDAANFELSDYTPLGGTWSGTGIVDGNLGTFSPIEAGLGTTELTYTFTDPTTTCINSRIHQINVYQVLVDVSENSTTYCNTNNTYNFSSQVTGNLNGGSGVWEGNSIDSEGIFNPSLVDVAIGIDTLIYTFMDGLGCGNSDTLIVEVIQAQTVEAGLDEEICKNGNVLILSGFSPEGGTWSGSPAISGNEFDPSLSTAEDITLTYSIGEGSCLVQDTKVITVHPIPVLTIPNNMSICLNEGAVDLSASPEGGTWSGEGITNSTTGIFTPTSAGNFEITYTYTNPTTNCTHSESFNIYVEGIPDFSFVASELVCINIPIDFNVEGGDGTTCMWNFGDGNTSNNCTTSHTYTDIGFKTISLTVTTPLGCNETRTQEIFVSRPPESDFTHNADNTDFQCTPLDVTFNNLSNSFGTDATYTWDMGNGDTIVVENTNELNYTYIGEYIISDTTFYITLTVENACSTAVSIDSVKVKPTPQVQFGPKVTKVCSGTPLDFNNITIGNPDYFIWDFGDGTGSTEVNPPPHAYFTGEEDTTYILQLIAGNECGTDTVQWDILVKPNTVESFFNTSVIEGCVPLTVDFQDFSTDGVNLYWDFGDGNFSNEETPSNTFEEAGTYTTMLIADNNCAFDTSFQVIEVLPQPTIEGFVFKEIACVGESVVFSATTNDAISSYTWYFAEEDSSFQTAPTYIFTTPGTKEITLVIVSALNECPNTYTTSIEVIDRPIPVFETVPAFGCSPLEVQLVNLSENSVAYEWNFGDGSSSIEVNPSHTFFSTTDTIFIVTLISTNAANCQDSVKHPVTVKAQPIAAFSASEYTHCDEPVVINLFNESQGDAVYAWYLDGELIAESVNTDVLLDAIGDYEIKLIATNNFGCFDEMDTIIRVIPEPMASIASDVFEACEKDAVFFENTSTDYTHVYWDFGDGDTSTLFQPYHLYDSAGVYNLQLVVSYDDICFDTLQLSQAVHIAERPTAEFNHSSTDIPIADCTVTFENGSFEAIKWYWDFGDGSSSTEEHPIYRYYENGEKIVVLIAENSIGCTDTISKIIEFPFCKGLFFPNIFTPDVLEKEVNEFRPSGVGLEFYHVKVYAKNGELVWESTLLNQGRPVEAWNGMYQNVGKPLPQGAYAWEVNYIFSSDMLDGREVSTIPTRSEQGSVTLIRGR